jgi:hypothetical protein
MPLPVSLRAVMEEMDALEGWAAHLNTRTGELFTEPTEDAPDGQEFRAKAEEKLAEPGWEPLPDRFEIDEWSVMADFSERMPDGDRRTALLHAIRGGGAFGRLKSLVRAFGIEQQWYGFREAALAGVARRWLEVHGVPYIDDVPAA